MSATVVHPKEVPTKGPSGRTIGMVVVGFAIAIGIGYAIANPPVTEAVAEGQPSIVTVEFQSAAERQLRLIEATKGVELSSSPNAWESKAKFLEEQYKAQNERPLNGMVSPLKAE